MSVYPRPGTLLRVLAGIIATDNPITIETFLDVEHRGELNIIFRALSSLIEWETPYAADQDDDLQVVFGRPGTRLRFCHLSFREYLLDRNRSGPFFVDFQESRDELFNHRHDMIIGSLMGIHDDRRGLLSVYDDMWMDLTYEEIQAVQDECFRQILPTSSFLLTNNVPYFLAAKGSLTVDDVSNLLEFDEELTKKWLIEHSTLICADYGTPHVPLPTLFQEYGGIGGLHVFLSSASRGGIFHIKYRKQCIRLSRESLACIDIEKGRSPTWYDDKSFLINPDISDIKFAEDEDDGQNMRLFINRLCESNKWTESGFPDDDCLGLEIEVIKWMHRQLASNILDQSTLPPLLADKNYGLVEKMLRTMAQIYDARVIPGFYQPYLSRDPEFEQRQLSCIEFPPRYTQGENHLLQNTIPPYNILPLEAVTELEVKFGQRWLNHVDRSFKITKALEEATYYFPPNIRDKCYTNFVESYLITYATYFHSNLHPDSRRIPTYFACWFSHAYPSKRILVGLWTLYYLSPKTKPKWTPPTGFCSGAMGYLERYSFDPKGELHSWLEDLIGGSWED
ncbi:hypothetical protein BYT27DRAFT_7210917 [Phlegmacium glaucopus]|nr:hypothetical protein BYT27DRAFT_7210917 [Phlegmacium glaucopus]